MRRRVFADCQEEAYQSLNVTLTSAITVMRTAAVCASLIAEAFEERECVWFSVTLRLMWRVRELHFISDLMLCKERKCE